MSGNLSNRHYSTFLFREAKSISPCQGARIECEPTTLKATGTVPVLRSAKFPIDEHDSINPRAGQPGKSQA